MHRLIFRNKPTQFLNVQAQPLVFKTLEDLINLKDMPNTDGVILGSILQELHITEVGDFIKLVGSKLINGGTVLINGVDSMELCRTAHNEEVDVPTFNRLMFGDCNRSLWNIVTIDMMMQQIGVQAQLKKIGGIGNMEYFYKGVKS